jgi:hypothetical protein
MNDPRNPQRRNNPPPPPSLRASDSSSSKHPNSPLPPPPQPGRDASTRNPVPQPLSPTSLNPSGSGAALTEPVLGRGTFNTPQSYYGQLGELSAYNIPPGGPLVWNWSSPAEFGIFGTYYEPQGELSQELQAQIPPTIEFSNPIPVREPIAEEGTRNLSMNATLPSQSFPPLAAPLRRESLDTMNTRAGMKRKVNPDGNAPQTAQDQAPPKKPSISKASASSSHPQASRSTRSKVQEQDPDTPRDADAPTPTPTKGSDEGERAQTSTQNQVEAGPSTQERRIAELSSKLTTVLPAGKVFPIQISSELFRLSGASISSDEHPHTSRIILVSN